MWGELSSNSFSVWSWAHLLGIEILILASCFHEITFLNIFFVPLGKILYKHKVKRLILGLWFMKNWISWEVESDINITPHQSWGTCCGFHYSSLLIRACAFHCSWIIDGRSPQGVEEEPLAFMAQAGPWQLQCCEGQLSAACYLRRLAALPSPGSLGEDRKGLPCAQQTWWTDHFRKSISHIESRSKKFRHCRKY